MKNRGESKQRRDKAERGEQKRIEMREQYIGVSTSIVLQ
jgi:hypothetical protein